MPIIIMMMPGPSQGRRSGPGPGVGCPARAHGRGEPEWHGSLRRRSYWLTQLPLGVLFAGSAFSWIPRGHKRLIPRTREREDWGGVKALNELPVYYRYHIKNGLVLVLGKGLKVVRYQTV